MNANDIVLYSSDSVTFIPKEMISKGDQLLNCYKVIVSKMGAEHALEPDKDGKFRIITSSMKVIGPGEACTHSYFTVGCYDTRDKADYLLKFLRGKFARFLILLSMTSTNLSRNVLTFVPQQDFSKCYSDSDLYSKYELTSEEIEYIDNLMKEMI